MKRKKKRGQLKGNLLKRNKSILKECEEICKIIGKIQKTTKDKIRNS